MRQTLPPSHGYELVVNDIGRTVSPGETFDAPLLVPGCVPAEDGATEGVHDDDGTHSDEHTPPAPPDQPAAKGRAKAKE